MENWYWDLKKLLKMSIYTDEENLKEISDCMLKDIDTESSGGTVDYCSWDADKNQLTFCVAYPVENMYAMVRKSILDGLYDYFESNFDWICDELENVPINIGRLTIERLMTTAITTPANMQMMVDILWFKKGQDENGYHAVFTVSL